MNEKVERQPNHPGALRHVMVTFVSLLAVFAVLVAACTPAVTEAPATEAPQVKEPTGAPEAEEPTEGPEEPAEPIKIGAPAPLTGPSAFQGEHIRNALTMGADEVNARGGVLGRPIEIVFEDDRADPKEAAAVAAKLVEEGVVAVVGNYGSGANMAAQPIYAEAGVPMVTAAVSAPDFTLKGYGIEFRNSTRGDLRGPIYAQFATQFVGATTAVILHDKQAFGQGLAEGFAAEFEKLGGTVLFIDSINIEDQDFTPILTKARGEDPDMMFYGGYYKEAGLLRKQMVDLGLVVPFGGAPELASASYLEIAGSAADGTFSVAGASAELYPALGEFIQKYEARFGIEPTEWAIRAYDCLMITVEAIERAGTTNRADVIEELRNTKAYPGLYGPVTFDENGDLTKAPEVVYWRVGDEWQIYDLNDAGEFERLK